MTIINSHESTRQSPFEAMTAFMDALLSEKASFKKDLICELNVLKQEVKALNTRSWFPIKNTPQKTSFELPLVVLDEIFKFATIKDWKNWQYVNKSWYEVAHSTGTMKFLSLKHFPNSSITQLNPNIVKDWGFCFKFIIAQNIIKQDLTIIERHQRLLNKAFLTSLIVSTTVFLPPVLSTLGKIITNLNEWAEARHRKEVLEFLLDHPDYTYEEASLELIQKARETMEMLFT